MTKSKIEKYENVLKWEKKQVDKQVQQLILAKAEEIAATQINLALEGNAQVGQYLLDRAFGKARQQIGLEGSEAGSPILVMPSVLVNKFNLNTIGKSEEQTPVKMEQLN